MVTYCPCCTVNTAGVHEPNCPFAPHNSIVTPPMTHPPFAPKVEFIVQAPPFKPCDGCAALTARVAELEETLRASIVTMEYQVKRLDWWKLSHLELDAAIDRARAALGGGKGEE